MFGKVIVFGLFKIIKKKKSEDHVLGSGFSLWVGYDDAGCHMIRSITSPYVFKNYDGQTLECNLKVEIPIRLQGITFW